MSRQQRPDPAVSERLVRRRFDAEYKTRIGRDQLTGSTSAAGSSAGITRSTATLESVC